MRAAVHRTLLTHELDGAPTTLAWVLPVGALPAPGALGVLVDTWRRSPSTGLVGPKHLDADDPHLLRALAIHSTRGGRLLPRPAPGEPDQGQYDRDSDALAVPFAGSLVERDLLVELRGWETSFGDVAADLDLGWRAHDLGRRVVVAPAARLRTARGVAVATASSAARRRAARRVALARAPWWIAPLLALWIAVTSVVAALGLLLLKRPRSAGAELSSLASLDPFRGTSARWRTRHPREVGRRDLRALFEPRRSVLTGWGDAVHDALVSPRPPIGDAANDLNPRSWFVKVVRHPGVLAATGALVVTVVAGRSLGAGVVTGLGSGLTGGEVVGTRASAGTLWSAWTDGWTGAGLGGPDPVGPHAPLLALPTWLVDHLPLLPSPTSPAGFVVGLVVLLGMPLAAASAFIAFRTMVPSRPVRGLAAFAWATTGVAAASVAQGRLGAVVALVLLPFLASGLWLVGDPALHGDERLRHRPGRGRARGVRPGAARRRGRPRPRPRPRPPRGPHPRPRRRRRPGRRPGAVAGPRRRGVVAGARRRRGPGAVGRVDARAVAAGPPRTRRRRLPARRGPALPLVVVARARAGPRPRLGHGDDLPGPAGARPARRRPRRPLGAPRHRPGRRRRGR